MNVAMVDERIQEKGGTTWTSKCCSNMQTNPPFGGLSSVAPRCRKLHNEADHSKQQTLIFVQ